MNTKILRMLGLARRSGSLVYGITAVKTEVLKKKSQLVIIAADTSENSRKEFSKFLSNTTWIEIPFTKEEIGYAIGSKPTGIISISNENFKKGILEVNLIENKND